MKRGKREGGWAPYVLVPTSICDPKTLRPSPIYLRCRGLAQPVAQTHGCFRRRPPTAAAWHNGRLRQSSSGSVSYEVEFEFVCCTVSNT